MLELNENLTHSMLYKQLYDIGCVLEFVDLNVISSDIQDREHLHQQAALTTLFTLRDRSDSYYEALMQTPEYRARNREEFFRLSINIDKLGPSVSVSAAEFLGSLCDLQTRRLAMPGATKGNYNKRFWFGDEEHHRNQIAYSTKSADVKGLSDAYLDTPYGLSGTKDAVNDLFFEVVDKLLDGVRENLQILSWNPDWSNYFDAGKEWWGTYFWTFHYDGTNRIVGIAASTTD
jgi:hypothetical protein